MFKIVNVLDDGTRLEQNYISDDIGNTIKRMKNLYSKYLPLVNITNVSSVFMVIESGDSTDIIELYTN